MHFKPTESQSACFKSCLLIRTSLVSSSTSKTFAETLLYHVSQNYQYYMLVLTGKLIPSKSKSSTWLEWQTKIWMIISIDCMKTTLNNIFKKFISSCFFLLIHVFFDEINHGILIYLTALVGLTCSWNERCYVVTPHSGYLRLARKAWQPIRLSRPRQVDFVFFFELVWRVQNWKLCWPVKTPVGRTVQPTGFTEFL